MALRGCFRDMNSRRGARISAGSVRVRRWASSALGLGQLASRQSARHREQSARSTRQALSPGRANGQPLVARAGERRAALHPLRSVVRPSTESLPATGAGPPFPLQAQAVCGRCVIRLVSGGFPVRRSAARRPRKLHIGLDQAGHLPSFLSVTDGTADVARTWTFEAGSVVVADRAYLDFVVSPVAGPWRHLRDTPQARRAPGHPRA